MVKHKQQTDAAAAAGNGGATAVTPGKHTLTQSLAAPAAPTTESFYDDAATRLAAAGYHLQQDVVRWNVGLDVLNPGMVRSAGEQAMTDFLLVLQQAGALRGSPMAEAAERAHEAARELVAQLGLFHFMHQPITARAVTIEDTMALTHIEKQIERADRCIADALRLFELCRGGTKVAGAKLDPAARLEIGQLLANHADNDEETRWLLAFMQGTGIRNTTLSMGKDTDADKLVMEMYQVQQDEQYFANKSEGQDFDAATVKALDEDAAQIEYFIAQDAYGWRYVEILKKYPPEKRVYLLQLLAHRHQLDNMVHRGGGDAVIALIHECPAGFSQWQYEYSRVTQKDTWDKIDDSASEMLSELPGAALEFAGGVYHEMGHLPAIGPVFERAGKSFDDLAAVTDDAIGVNKDDIKVRNAVAGTTGHVVGAIGISAVGGEAAEVKRAYDTGNTVQRAAALVLEVRDGFNAAKEKWETTSAIVTEVATGLTELTTDSIAGDPDRWKHVIGHLDGVLDIAIEKLGGMEGAKLGGAEGKRKKAMADAAGEKREEEIDKAGEAAMSQELKDEHAAAAAAADKLARARSPKKKSQYAAEVKAHAAKVRTLADRDALAITTARANAEREQDVEASRAAQQQADLEKAGDKAGYYKDKLADLVKEMIVGFTVGALTGAKEELVKAAERLADGKAADLDGRQMLIKALTKGGTNAIVHVVEPRVKAMLVKFFENALGDLLAEIDPELRGASTLAEGPIEEAVDWGLEQIGAEEWFEGKVEWLVEQAFGGNEALASGGGGEASE